MGIIAWIVLGLVAGLIANMLIPGRRQQGLILTCVIGVVGALLGGWLATKLFHIHSLQGFFNISTWLTAIAGAAVLLLAYHLFTEQSSRPKQVKQVRPVARIQPVQAVCAALRNGRSTNPRYPAVICTVEAAGRSFIFIGAGQPICN